VAALIAAGVTPERRGLSQSLSEHLGFGRSLIPDASPTAPNYWCTWAAQNYMYGHGFTELGPRVLEGDSGSRLARLAMNEQNVFGANGWATAFFSRIRKDAYFLFDDGWETGGTSTFVLDTSKFPSFSGTPVQRLTKLNRAIREAGWRGVALWCRNTPVGNAARDLEEACHAAGIQYWKIDMGDATFDLVRLRDQERIPLVLEHVHWEPPLNGQWTQDGRFGTQNWTSSRLQTLRRTDVYRTYDVTSILSLPTTLDRVANLLKGAAGHPEVQSLLNVEDEAYVAAVLGCTMGILRHPLTGLRPGDDVDLFFNGPRAAKRRMDEVIRALRWQHIAPPFASGHGHIQSDDEILVDSWTFAKGETWESDIVGVTVRQGAPARIARCIDLPEVKAGGEKPFVFAARFPNGAVAVGAQERTQPGHAWHMPPCEVTLRVGDAPGPFGVFGTFDRLTLTFDRHLQGRRVVAQDLAGDDPVDISELVEIRNSSINLPGELLRRIGLHKATPGDLSSPGAILALA
jgi:hypothetical protein